MNNNNIFSGSGAAKAGEKEQILGLVLFLSRLDVASFVNPFRFQDGGRVEKVDQIAATTHPQSNLHLKYSS